ncbi:transketolase C-terminal domain-containing protein [Streptomyces sp. MP131-18]|uniref:transketolase family protein n=1 Tax=Streptomyces sp. MP131-18 TaxID=1857892 RepID=UPI00097C64D9|nr:transketolase C-terminal domain-containing protein [Streptomyces sp. MP131-18]ONK10464.1 1-deoxy-D-xylulose-5-phosphate synthase [Streptomyces sp. MP131-18]
MNGPVATRTAYRDHLIRLMRTDPQVVCVDTDTGLFAGADFGPAAERYLNLGIAEQNAMGVAAGLAASGWRPYVNTMAAFAASRAVEAVKIDIAYNALPVCIVATHGGVAAGHLGPTHHALEDLAVMRALPNMTVLIPGDAAACVSLLEQVRDRSGPAYVRLGRKATRALPRTGGAPAVGELQDMRDGDDVVIVATGPLPTLRSLAAADVLRRRENTHAAVVQAHTLKPFDPAALLGRVCSARLVVTVEEHWRTGGLGSTVAEVLADACGPPLVRLGFPDRFAQSPATQEQLLDAAELTATGIAERIRRALRAGRRRTAV